MASYLLTSPSSTLSIPKLATFSSNHRPLFLRTPHRSPSLCRAPPKWCLSAAAEAPSYEPVEAVEEETGDGLEVSETETPELVEAGNVPDSVEVQLAEFEASSESSEKEKGEDVYAVVVIGSRQYIVHPGRYLYTQRLKGANVNDKCNRELLKGGKRDVDILTATTLYTTNQAGFYNGQVQYLYCNQLKIILNQVLLVGTRTKYYIGQPIVTNAAVHAVIEEQGKDPKVIIFKFKRKKNYRRKIGHRQPNTRLRIVGITGYEDYPAD